MIDVSIVRKLALAVVCYGLFVMACIALLIGFGIWMFELMVPIVYDWTH